ncbi:sensor histidine kinase [Streptococcus phocae subsp. salmonis]
MQKGAGRCAYLPWLYLLAYIVFSFVFLNYYEIIWYFFFTSHLLLFRFKDPLKHYRSFTFLGAVALVLGYAWLAVPDADIWQTIVISLLFVLGFYGIFLRIQQDAKQEEILLQKNSYINLLMAENERNRIARDLHDTLGHVFAMMTVKSELALKQLEKGETERVAKELNDIHELSKSSMSNVRKIINDLKFRTLDEELATTSEMFALTDITMTIDNSLESDLLSPIIQSTLIMVIRELCNNIIKHSKAKNASIKLYRTDDIILEVSDDGVGFSQLTGKELASVRERLTLVKGQLRIVSALNPTCVIITLKEGIVA